MPIYHFLCQRDVGSPVDDEYDNEGNSSSYEDVSSVAV